MACLFALAACGRNQPPVAESTPQKLASEKPAARLDNPWKNRTGELLTDDEFSQIFGAAGLKSLNRIQRENYCLFEWLKPDWVVRDNSNDNSADRFTNPKNNLIFSLIDFGRPETAAAIFKQKVELRTEHWNDKIDGIGQGALWSSDNRRLIVLAAHFIINIDVSVEDEAVANLPKARAVAAVVIPKLEEPRK